MEIDSGQFTFRILRTQQTGDVLSKLATRATEVRGARVLTGSQPIAIPGNSNELESIAPYSPEAYLLDQAKTDLSDRAHGQNWQHYLEVLVMKLQTV